MSCPACATGVPGDVRTCTCAVFDCEPDLPKSAEHPFGFACDDVAGGVSCRQYEQVRLLRAEVERLKALAVCPKPCCAPGRRWIGAHGLEIQAGRR